MHYRLPHPLSALPRVVLLFALVVAVLAVAACSDDPVSEEPPPTPEPTEVTVEGTAQDTTGAAVAGGGRLPGR